MANIFRAKSLISRTGVFSNEVLSPNLVYNTGDQSISGVKNFYSRPTVDGTGVLLSGEAANLPDTIVYTSGNQTISGIKTFDIAPVVSGNSLITGNLSLYATTINLENTGLTLTNSINSLSGIFTGFTGNLDLTYATDTQLFNTGSTLDIKINSLSGSLNSSGINLTNRINLLSGVSVLSYGNQNITGNKTFINNIEVQGTGIFNALDLSNISDFSFSGVTINLIDSTVQSSGQIYISGNPVSTGTVILPNTIVYTTGDQIISGIKDFYDQLRTFGDVDLNYAPFTNKRIRIWTTGLSAGAPIPFIGTLIDISGIYIQNGMVLKINDVEVTPSLYATIDNLASTGLNLSNSIDSLSGLFTGYTGNLDATFATDIQLFNTGSNLDTKINNLSGVTVLTYGNQTISGNKTFTNNVEIISPVSGMYGTGNLLNALNVRGFASVNADLSSLTGLITISGSGISGTSPGQFSVGGLLIGQNEGGGYLGRTNIRENSWEVVSGSIANIWISGETDRNWRDIAMSSDGKIQTALASDVVFSTPGKIYISNDYGKIWKEINILNQWQGIAMSSDGKIQTAITYDNTYVSHNYGVDWEIKPSGVGGFDISVSSDGRIQGVVKGSNAYISYDYGNTWNIKSPNVFASPVNIKLSSDGRIQVINGSDGFYGVGDWGYIHISYDYGNTWKQLNTEVGAIYRDIAISADGRIIAAAHINGPISMSYDYGTTWINKATNITISHIYGITMSADGRTIVAAIHNSAIPTNKIYISTDYGNTWQYKSDLYANGNDRTQSIAMSSDGRIITNVYDYGKIWTSYASTLSPNSINVLGSITAHDNVNISGNLNVTGNILLSGNPVLTGVDLSSYATTTNLASTGLTLDTKINTLSGSSVLLYGDQNISGNKTFINNITVSGTGTFNAIDLDNIDNLSLSGVDVTLTNSIVNVAGNIFISGNPVLTGVNLSSYATTSNLANTGSTLDTKIDNLSGYVTGANATFASITNLANTGSTLDTKINNLSGYINSTSSNIVFTTGNQIISGFKTFVEDTTFGDTGQGDFLVISGNNFTVYGSGNFTSGLFVSGSPVLTGSSTLYATTANLALTGSTLNSNINSLSGLFTGFTGALDTTFASDIQLANTGSTLDTKINNLSGVSVLTFGNQNISGIKTFNSGLATTYISGVSGSSLDIIGFSGTSVNINAGNSLVGSNAGDVTLTAGNSPTLRGSINLIAGTGGQGVGIVSPGINLYAGQSPTYDGNNNIFGNINVNKFLTFQPIGPKTISIYRSGQGQEQKLGVVIDNDKVDVNNGMLLQVSGVNVTPSLYATSTNLASTGSTLNSSIDSLSGLFTGYTGTLDATYATDIQVLNTGITLNTRINNLSGYVNSTSSNIVFTTGNQNIAGNKTFTGVVTFSGQEVNIIDTALNLSGLGDMTFSGTNINFINSPVFISGTNLRVIGDVLGNNLVYKTGNQTISGTKTFTDGTLNVSIKPQNSGLEIDNGPFIIRSANGTYGAARVEVLNEDGANGFTVINEGLDLADFGLQSANNKKINFRLEGREEYANNNNQEFQVIDVSDNANGIYYARFGNSNIVIGENSEKIGVGILSPVSKLHVEGDASNNSTLKVGTLELQPYAVNNAWFGDNTYYNGGFYRREAGYAGAFYFQGPEGQFRFADTDDAGTTYTPAVQLKTHLDGRFGVGSGISTDTNDFTNSNFFVNSNGNVGINTLTPSEKFQVNGNVLISGNTTVSGSINISGNPVLTGVDLSTYATTANLALTGSTLDTKINNVSGYAAPKDIATTINISSNTISLDLSAFSYFLVNLNSNITTANFNNPKAAPEVTNFVLQLSGDGTIRSVTWPTSLRWPGSAAPTITIGPNKVDTYSIFSYDGGVSYYGFPAGYNS